MSRHGRVIKPGFMPLMPEHVHLLINEPPSTLVAQFLKAVKQTSPRRLKGNREQFWHATRLSS
ncbi:MAG: transposase [Acidobacteria bacterium]|nr:transposase [Acidobacteriota bacterium]